jgi:hypothetical protein
MRGAEDWHGLVTLAWYGFIVLVLILAICLRSGAAMQTYRAGSAKQLPAATALDSP